MKWNLTMTRLFPYEFALVLACLAVPTQQADALTSAEVFAKVSPSIVLIRDMEGHGSGVVLSATGHVLSNYHVVNTPLPLSVTARVRKNGQLTTVTFKDVTLVGVHPKYDAAILKINATGYTFVPIRRKQSKSPDSDLVATGEKCYAIGNPGGGGDILGNTITEGIVSAMAHRIDGLPHIQTTSRINPGNSGGALCNAGGQLVGIVTFKILGAKRMGFAIPVQRLLWKEFVKPDKRPGDKIRFDNLYRVARDLFERSRKAGSEEERERLAATALFAYRQALCEFPDSAACLFSIGAMYLEIGEPVVAEAFVKRAIELGMDSADVYEVRGRISRDQGRIKEAIAFWRKGMLRRGEEKPAASACMANYAKTLMEAERFAESAYLIRWAIHLDADQAKKMRADIMRRSDQQLTEKQYHWLANRGGAFSTANLEAFLDEFPGRTVHTPAQTPDRPVDIGRFRKLLAASKKPDPHGLVRVLPEHPSAIYQAYFGVYLVFRFDGIRRVGVFNTLTAEFDKFVKLDAGNALVAAGGKYLLVHHPESSTTDKWDLETMQMRSHILRLQPPLAMLDMASDCGDRAVIAWLEPIWRFGLLELDSFKWRELYVDREKSPSTERVWGAKTKIRVQTDPQFERLLFYFTNLSPTSLGYMDLSAQDPTDDAWTFSYESRLSALGTRFVGRSICDYAGNIVNSRLQPIKKLGRVYGVLGAEWFARYDSNDKKYVVAEIDGERTITSFSVPKSAFIGSSTVWSSAYVNRTAIVSRSKVAGSQRTQVTLWEMNTPKNEIKLPSR